MNYETLIYQETDKIARITLNRPKGLNAINAQTQRELLEAVAKAARDDDVQGVIVTGAERSFCAHFFRDSLIGKSVNHIARDEWLAAGVCPLNLAHKSHKRSKS